MSFSTRAALAFTLVLSPLASVACGGLVLVDSTGDGGAEAPDSPDTNDSTANKLDATATQSDATTAHDGAGSAPDATTAHDAGRDASDATKVPSGDSDTTPISPPMFDAATYATKVPACSRAVEFPFQQGFAVDSAGNIVIVGQFTTPSDFGGGVVNPLNGYAVFVAKYDSSCRLSFLKMFSGAANHWAAAVAIDGADRIHVTGAMDGTLDFGGGALVANGRNPWVATLTPAGDYVSARVFANTTEAQPLSIAVTPDGVVAMLGTYAGAPDFGDGPLATSDQGLYVVKLAADGSFAWSAGAARYAVPTFGNYTVAIDHAGNVYAGQHLDPGHLFLAKYASSDGALAWKKDNWPAGAVHGVVVDGAGDLIVTGLVAEGGDLGNGKLAPSGSQQPMFLAKVASSDGSVTWSRSYLGDSYPSGVALDAQGRIFIGGQSYDWKYSTSRTWIAVFDPGSGDELAGWLFDGNLVPSLAIGPFGERVVMGSGWGVNLGSGVQAGNLIFGSLP